MYKIDVPTTRKPHELARYPHELEEHRQTVCNAEWSPDLPDISEANNLDRDADARGVFAQWTFRRHREKRLNVGIRQEINK
jgi:hypothetical protein